MAGVGPGTGTPRHCRQVPGRLPQPGCLPGAMVRRAGSRVSRAGRLPAGEFGVDGRQAGLDRRADRVFEDPATVSRVTVHYKSLQSEALPNGASRELIARVAEERWKATAP